MSISIGSNIAALQAQRRVAESSHGLQQTFERLSSGLRINRAGDDAAGLAISESLKADSRVYNQGIRNLNDGLGLTNVADSALENLSTIVTRLKELAEQAANGVYGTAQRGALDKEAQKLSAEFSRIVNTTQFNGRNLLTASFGNITVQGGYGVNGGIQGNLGGAVGTGSLGAAVSFGTNVGIGSELTAGLEFVDLNKDGILDMLTAGTTNNLAYSAVRLGNGDGTFGAAVSFAINGEAIRNMVVGDLNNDGNLDVAVIVNNALPASYVGIQLGNGDGTFRAATTYLNFGNSSLDISLADVNGDGILDVAAASNSASLVTLRLGAGDGTFGSAISFENLQSIASVQLADVNGDGRADMLFSGLNNTVSVAFGNGNATFGAFVSYAGGGGNSDIATADLNGDGLLDIVTAGGGVGVNLNLGNGTFSAGTSYLFQSATIGVRVADINGDGINDLLAGGLSGSGLIGIRYGNGDGTFQAANTYVSEASLTIAVAVGDLNQDGVLDVGSAGIGGTDGYATTWLQTTTTGTNALLPFSLSTRAGALQALAPLDRKLSQIANQRGTIGALQSRVSTAINNLQTSTENYQTAASRISDADIAEESAKLVKGQILQQAATAVLGQANQQPAIVLSLLRAARQ